MSGLVIKGEKVLLGGKLIARFVSRFDGEGKDLVCHRTDKHFFRKYSGFGFNAELMDMCVGVVNVVKLIYRGKRGNRVFVASPERIVNCGTVVKEDGYERQYVLSERDFEVVHG